MTTKHPSLGNNHITSSPRFWIVSPGRAVLFLITVIVLLYGVVYPNAQIVFSSLRSDGSWSLATYQAVLSQGAVIEAVLTSLGVSILTVIFCALVGATGRFWW